MDSQKPVLENRLPLDDRNKSLGDTRQLPSQAAPSAAFDSLKQPSSSQQDINSYVPRSNDDQFANQANDQAVGRQQQLAALNYGEAPYVSSTFGALKTRSASNSALKQPDSVPTSTKKCVTFNDNMVTEYSFNRSYGSTSSESSFAPQSPADVAERSVLTTASKRLCSAMWTHLCCTERSHRIRINLRDNNIMQQLVQVAPHHFIPIQTIK